MRSTAAVQYEDFSEGQTGARTGRLIARAIAPIREAQPRPSHESKPLSEMPLSQTEVMRATQSAANAIPQFRPIGTKPIVSFVPLQEWEGYVTSVEGDTFMARLIDVTGSDTLESEETELLVSDLSDEDKKCLDVGAVFRWTIGYQISRGKPRLRASQIAFRTIPSLTSDQLHAAKNRGKARVAAIKWE